MSKAPEVAKLIRQGMANLERRAEAMLELGTAVTDRGHKVLDFCEADFNALAVELADLEAALQREESNSAKGTPEDAPKLDAALEERNAEVAAALSAPQSPFEPYDPVNRR